MSKISKPLNLLLELGCEEIPARFMPGFLADLKAKAEEKLKKERLVFDRVTTLGTNRRLVLFIENLASAQADLSEEVKGPPADIAFDQSGNPKPPAIGFAKSQGIDIKEIIVKPLGNKNYLFARIERRGSPTARLLPILLPEIIASLYQPLAMRWGDLDFKFIRPIHWIVALYGAKIVKFELAGVKTGNKTAPHHFVKNVGTGLVPVRTSGQPQGLSLQSYKNQLLKLGVIVDQQEREALVKAQIETAARKAGATAQVPADLLAEVNFLVENPIAYIGSFDPKFLEVPSEVLTTSMKKNQKYFPLIDKSGALAPRFIVVTNGCREKSVVEGNRKVLTARLADARFFFEEDKKLPLKMRTADLAGIVFFEKLGSLADKAERLARLAEYIGKQLALKNSSLALVDRIARLCKADLTTKMVYEFPELQGTMGQVYALLEGEDPIVAQGIFEHYLPRFGGDDLPLTPEGTTVALADRLDSLIGYFGVGAVPTGSEDPYGLRRAALGIIRIMLEKKLNLALDDAIEHGYKLYDKSLPAQDFARVKRQLLEFIFSRLKPALIDQGIRYDIADAVLADCSDVSLCADIAIAITKTANQKWFQDLVRSADRISRIAKEASRETVVTDDLIEKEEKELHDLYLKVNWETAAAARDGQWDKVLQKLAELTPAVDLFFDKILVMHQEERIKTNRLALLKGLEKSYRLAADFSKIVIDGDKK
ncbi:MAG: glycine--tRNA ligase subunit beta [Candidatus Margulisbacteria bacterium]|nr:glycine--tRNA ligase subunit beta [Candidatus Margulisiibacteriota bacterium]